jgi:hypothetical protein
MAERKLRLIASLYCSQYKTDAKLYIEAPHPSGQRHLVAQYEKVGGREADLSRPRRASIPTRSPANRPLIIPTAHGPAFC